MFAQFCHNYIDVGFSVIPVIRGQKHPPLKNWSEYCRRLPSESELDSWCKKYANANIGLCLGPASGVIAFDFDYWYDPVKCQIGEAEFKKDYNFIEHELLKNFVSKSPVRKKGQKGWTAFFRAEDQKNFSCNRNGIRLFDLLCDGRQTVMPPSLHPSGKQYIYLDEDLIDWNPEDLPALDYVALKEFASFYGAENVGVGGRHGEVLKYAFKIIEHCKNEIELRTLMITFDKKAHDIPYLSDKKYFKSSEPMVNVESWTPRIISFYKRENPEWSFGKRPTKGTAKFEPFQLFFNKKMPEARRCQLRDTVLEKHDGIWVPILNKIKSLKSHAMDRNLNDSKVEQHLYRWCEEKKPELLIKFDKWDETARIGDLLDHFKLKNVSFECFEDLFKWWMLKAIAKAMGNTDAQNQVIVLKGDQGIGKDYFVEKLCRPLDLYFSEISLSKEEQKNYENIDGLIVANIPEIDKYRDVTVEVFKDLVTRKRASFRSPYDRKTSEKKLTTSYIASCNRDDLLRDHTGNRRFAIFDIDSIDHSYSKDRGFYAQIWAEIDFLRRSEWKPKASSVAEMDRYIKAQTPENPDLLIIEHYDAIMAKYFAGPFSKNRVSYAECKDQIDELAKYHRRALQTVQNVLTRHRRRKRVGGVSYYYVTKTGSEPGSVATLDDHR